MNAHILDRLSQQYYFQIRNHFNCRLDCKVEAERLTWEALRNAAATTEQTRTDRAEILPLSIMEDLLRQHYPVPPPSPEEVHDQAAALYMRLRTRQGNPGATVEASLAIHHWIGADPYRRAAYDRARKALYRKETYQAATARDPSQDVSSPELALNADMARFDKSARLGWIDTTLLLFVFFLVLPMIYFLAMPLGS